MTATETYNLILRGDVKGEIAIAIAIAELAVQLEDLALNHSELGGRVRDIASALEK